MSLLAGGAARIGAATADGKVPEEHPTMYRSPVPSAFLVTDVGGENSLGRDPLVTTEAPSRSPEQLVKYCLEVRDAVIKVNSLKSDSQLVVGLILQGIGARKSLAFETQPVPSSMHPVWNESFNFRASEDQVQSSGRIAVEIVEKESDGTRTVLGKAKVSLNEVYGEVGEIPLCHGQLTMLVDEVPK